MLEIKTFQYNMFSENSYILSDPESRECVFIDCGALSYEEVKALTDYVATEQLHPVRLIATHGHFDHNFGVPAITKEYGLSLELHEKDEPLLRTMAEQARKLGGIDIGGSDGWELKCFGDDYTFTLGGYQFTAIHTPGHTKGSVCFYSEGAHLLFSGDTLFMGTIGRTDLPYGSMFEMTNSLRRLCQLPDETIVYPGHGPRTTMAQELSTNPFLDR